MTACPLPNLQLYVEDFVATARWPQGLVGNWQRLPKLPGQLRLCTRSLFFEPDDVRVPIVRCATCCDPLRSQPRAALLMCCWPERISFELNVCSCAAARRMNQLCWSAAMREHCCSMLLPVEPSSLPSLPSLPPGCPSSLWKGWRAAATGASC